MNTLNDYQKIAHQSVDQLFKEVDQLKQKGQFIKQEKKQMFEQKLADLEKKKEVLRTKYNDLSSASGQATEELKNGFEQAKGALTSAWKEAREEFVS
jgi:hypothetical protein